MANGQTANYGLNQWIPEDLFLREEFNTDNSKIDEALAGLQGQVDALESGAAADLETVRSGLQSQITALDGELGAAQSDLQGKINTTSSNLTTAKNDLQSQITALDTKIDDGLTDLEIDLESQISTTASTAASNLATAKSELQAKINTVSSNLTTAKTDLQTKLSTTNSNLTTAKNSLQSQITALNGNKCEIVMGTYTGNGAPSQTISLGFTPKAVLSVRRDGSMGNNYDFFGGLALNGAQVYEDSGSIYPILTIVDGGFTVYYTRITSSYLVASNYDSYIFHYIAVR